MLLCCGLHQFLCICRVLGFSMLNKSRKKCHVQRKVPYLIFEYTDIDHKKFINSFRQSGENSPAKTVKVRSNPYFRLYWSICLWNYIIDISLPLQSLMYQFRKGVSLYHVHRILHRCGCLLILINDVIVVNYAPVIII